MEILFSSETTASCNGKSSDINVTINNNNEHPTIYLHLPPQGVVQCSYCSRYFGFKGSLK